MHAIKQAIEVDVDNFIPGLRCQNIKIAFGGIHSRTVDENINSAMGGQDVFRSSLYGIFIRYIQQNSFSAAQCLQLFQGTCVG